MPDQDLLRILTELRRRREELDNMKFEIRREPPAEDVVQFEERRDDDKPVEPV